MHNFIYHLDKPRRRDLREKTRPAHLVYADTIYPKLVVAGPTLDSDEKTMDGGVWAVGAESKDKAEATTKADPYEQVDLFQFKIIQPILKVIPKDTN